MKEDKFVQEVLEVAERALSPPFLIKRGAVLLYQVEVNNRLEVTVDPRRPKRGNSAFQTDLCIFEKIDANIEIPRVVMEFKRGISTHDVLTYSAKARKHKQIYPYLRYGLVIGKETSIPKRVFTHNESLDFCLAAASFKKTDLREILASILRKEIEVSRMLENISFGKISAQIFRSDIKLT